MNGQHKFGWVFRALLLGLLIPATLQAAGKKYALVVGVETYDPRFLNKLSYADEDATEMSKALTLLGFDVIVMTQEAKIPAHKPSTAAKILDQLQRRLKGLRKEDTVIVTFSGHGVQFKQPKKLADGTTEQHFFCPEEANLTKPDSLVPIGKVYALIKDCAAERKLLIVDACRNEPISKLGKGMDVELEPAGVTPRTVPKGMLALYSCSAGDKSWEHPDLKHGVFCYQVLQYLQGKASPRYYFRNQVTIRGLADFVYTETRDYVFKKLSGDQFPELVGRTSDWPFGIKIESLITNSIGMEFRKS